ncbi:uncharacterized protein RSE6_00457 [Rhynchosporium secalis]|uniref:Methyltransferase domain-containing protein n=1 Tax=Rhynchosporium secalis TaxID=38038 RepID=A0A1E1LVD8_RHYSE|nr:uncharacterized protein RSE6_00457 [Rhynchosporium secalis]
MSYSAEKSASKSNLPKANKENQNIWPTPTLAILTHSQISLLHQYANIPLDSTIPHVLSTRDQAWKVHPRPYIGQLRFLDLALSTFSSYPPILALLISDPDAKLLDLACCVGQEIQKLIHDSAVASSLYGAELRSEFIELGYGRVFDRGKIGVTFLIAFAKVIV